MLVGCPFQATVRCRTGGDRTGTAAVELPATTIARVVAAIAATRVPERGQTAPTIEFPKPGWKTASAKVISDAAAADVLRPVGHSRHAEFGTGRSTGPWPGECTVTELLRFTTAGSVDDGKSTLIGRLLFDAKQTFEDQMSAI